MHYYTDIITHGRPLVNQSVVGTGGEVHNILLAYHLSETNGSYQARTWTARLTDRDANHYAISPPHHATSLVFPIQRHNFMFYRPQNQNVVYFRAPVIIIHVQSLIILKVVIFTLME